MRVVIAEDSAILRDGLAQLLTMRGVEVVAAVDNADALLSAAEAHHPDVAIIDVRLPPDHTDEGLRAAIALRTRQPGTGVLIFSQYVETRSAARLLTGDAAGVGYLLKERVVDIDEFVSALERVAAGGTALDPQVVSRLINSSRRDQALGTLTPREREVLTLMAEGRTNQSIAATLVVTERAVEKHVANIFTKLELLPTGTDHRRVLAVLRYFENR